MAYAAIVSLKLTLQNILLHPHRYTIPCEKKDIESLYEKFEFLQQFVEEYGHPSSESDGDATVLEGRIRDAAYGAEDFMDLHLNNPSLSKNYLSSAINYLRFLGDALENGAYRNLMVEKIKMKLLIKKVDSIVGEVTKIKEQRRGSMVHQDFEPRNYLSLDAYEFVSSTRKSVMVGFKDHLEKIMDQLTGQSSALQVISIVGMGGIGKTTLATHIYNDPYVVDHFYVCARATVCPSYSVRLILLDILASMERLTNKMLHESDDRQLELQVYQNLKGQRYLIIVDDIWDTGAWDALKMFFPDDKNGSRIILTTRIAHVAKHASPSGTPHQINPLKDDQSWTLLRTRVFGDEPCPCSLEEVGKTIAHSCLGLPLSIVVIGGLLSKMKRTRVAWESVAADITSSSADQCTNILRLSYNYLPQYLKACFLYMGVFPKSYDIRVSKLTKMWAAEGFLRNVDGQSPEDVAERCVKDLFDRSLILMIWNNSEGKIKTFRIHDLLLDLCLEEAKNEKFLQIRISRDKPFPPRLSSRRRISMHIIRKFKHLLFPFDYLSCPPCIRSLIFVGRCSVDSRLFSEFKLLRVLDAARVEFPKFPAQVLELLSLRYIAIMCDGDIPASITKLWNLQTLIVVRTKYRKSKACLPAEIWIMTCLRHVRCDGAHLPDPTTAEFGFHRKNIVLEGLHTLSGLWNLTFTKEMLHGIANIKKLDIAYESFRWKEWQDYQLENLGNLHQLRALKINVIPSKGVYKNLVSPPMFKFHLPPSLKTLTLGGVGIPWHDLSIIGSLPNLEALKLLKHACLGTEWEPNEDEFSKLKVLLLDNLDLEHWTADSSHFPSLQRLIIRHCNSLVAIPSGMGESMTITEIELEDCKDSVLHSANEIREKLQSYGNGDDFQVICHRRSLSRNLAEQVAAELQGMWPQPHIVNFH